MARKRPPQRRTSQVFFIVLSILVVLSMAIGYLLVALPTPTPPESMPAATQTPVVLLIHALV